MHPMPSLVAPEKIIARGVALPERAAPALSPDGQWVFYGVTDPVAAQAIYAINITNGKTMVVPTRLVGAREPAVGMAGGKMMLAFTATGPARARIGASCT